MQTAQTSEELEEGAYLGCAECGTHVRLEQQGGGRMECCDAPLRETAQRGSTPGLSAKGERARCEGCGNEVTIERDGGGRLQCCNEEMVRTEE